MSKEEAQRLIEIKRKQQQKRVQEELRKQGKTLIDSQRHRLGEYDDV